MTKAIRPEDPNVESHPNGTVVATAEKLLKLPSQVQSNGKSAANEMTEDAASATAVAATAVAANDVNVKPTADVVVPLDGGWGWVVVLASFSCCLIVDGVVMTAGMFMKNVEEEFKASTAEVTRVEILRFTER